MSTSDQAPLPKLGQVFFDVRGDERTMRLSWHADTGIAVFSIWHGGTCTGTFRLPIADLPRMVESLRRGPRDAGDGPAGEVAGPAAEGRRPRRHGARPGAAGGDIETGQTSSYRGDPRGGAYAGRREPPPQGRPPEAGGVQRSGVPEASTSVYPGPDRPRGRRSRPDYGDPPLGVADEGPLGRRDEGAAPAGGRRGRAGPPADPPGEDGWDEDGARWDDGDSRWDDDGARWDGEGDPAQAPGWEEAPGWSGDPSGRHNAPPPESFPYGPPPQERRVRPRGRPPGRH